MKELPTSPEKRTTRHKQGEKLRDADKVERIPVKVIASDAVLRKPDWIRVRLPASPDVERIKKILRKNGLSSVCEEATTRESGRPSLPLVDFQNWKRWSMVNKDAVQWSVPGCFAVLRNDIP